MELELARELAQEADTKIVLLVMDGLGGLPHPETGRTELETAYTPQLDMLARESACGFTVPVGVGITPGSGPGHLALFGYDPLKFNIGRGVLEAVGIDFDLQPSDVAARGNFCTVDRRRGGSSTGGRGASALRKARGWWRGCGISAWTACRCSWSRCGSIVSCWCCGAKGFRTRSRTLTRRRRARSRCRRGRRRRKERRRLRWWRNGSTKRESISRDKAPANMLLLRGFAKRPDWPAMPDVFKLRPAAVAHYPMYRGLAKLVGMEALAVGPALEDSIATLRENWGRFDYFFVHYKYTDTAGEDGDFDRKVAKFEEVDTAIEPLIAMEPDVLMIAGDHSTPALMAAHSWHPVPFMLRSKWMRADECGMFSETELQRGSLGTFPAKEALPLAMAHAGRFRKYGA